MRLFWILGCLFGLLAVGAGAFGAHGLKGRLIPEYLAIFETAVRYQMYHAIALLAVAWAGTNWPSTVAIAAGWLFTVGILIFSGSLYVLTLTGTRWLGAVTPIGGVALIAGWAALALVAFRDA